MRDHFQIVRRRLGTGRLVPDRPTLHEDDGLLSVAPDGCCRQAQYIFGLGSFQNRVKRSRSYMVAFVNDDVTVIFNQGVNLILLRQRLHHGNVDLASRFELATADGADHTFANAKERLQTFLGVAGVDRFCVPAPEY